jgi:hypothetical protein
MPGWYIHTEAAKKAVDRLRAGDVPADFPGGIAAAQHLGEIAYQWRNYTAVGAIGPDIFFLLPDFKGTTGNVLLHFVEWIREVWEWIDENFMEKWEKWAEPAITGAGNLLNQISGQVLEELGQALQELAGAIMNAIIDLITKLWDWFGLLTSGVPQGFEESAFFWSDMFHYRKTSVFPQALFKNAANDQQRAFALGWMSHCATDITGHAFVNAKCGGPYRLHWQRHHLIENHMDALVYDSQHGGVEPYGELDTSALHFRLAFRKRNDAPYNGAEDAPAYDYFTGFPAYDPSSAGDLHREQLWDLDTGDLPDDLCKLIIETMKEVFGDSRDAPQILTDDDAQFRDGNSGRPSVEAIQNTFWTLYHFVKYTSTNGYSPKKPEPPDFIGDHSPPPFPGSDSGVSDDTTRGQDPNDDDDDWNLLDLLLALFAWAAYIAELGIWLATLPGAVIADILTYPAREVLYEYAVVPMWQLYMATRKPLVMTGFLMPKHEEISLGLVELGISPTGPLQALAAALASPTGTAPGAISFDEPSGRTTPAQPFGSDPAFPRAIIEDTPTTIAQIVGYLNPNLFCGNALQPSEFLSPWRYPATNNAGVSNGWEPGLSHPGPFQQGQDARVLMNNYPGNSAARQALENAQNPNDTEQACHTHLPADRHLGDSVDYTVYLMGKLAGGQPVSDFNLDSDRGYGHLCWEWDRRPNTPQTPGSSAPLNNPKYRFNEPCTIPEGYCQPGRPQYNPFVHLATHYGERPDQCREPERVDRDEVRQAGMLPTGQKG